MQASPSPSFDTGVGGIDESAAEVVPPDTATDGPLAAGPAHGGGAIAVSVIAFVLALGVLLFGRRWTSQQGDRPPAP